MLLQAPELYNQVVLIQDSRSEELRGRSGDGEEQERLEREGAAARSRSVAPPRRSHVAVIVHAWHST